LLAREGSRLRRVVSHLVAAAPGLILAAILAVRLLWMATFPSPRVPLYSVHDSQQLSRAFGELGLSYADALRYLRGPYSFDLASAGVLWSPWDAPIRHGLDDLRVLKVPEAAVDAIAPGWKAVRLGEGSVGILGPIHSWLRQDEMRYCAGRPGDDVRSATCRPFSDAVWRRLEGANTFIERMDDLQQAMSIWWPAPTPPSHTFRQEWLEIPIEITGDDAFRELELVDSASGNATRWPRWWVESIDGVGADTSPDGQRVKIWSGSRRKGSIRWTRNLIENGPPWQAGPGYVELRPGEEGLARWLQTISPVTRLLCGFGIPWQCP